MRTIWLHQKEQYNNDRHIRRSREGEEDGKPIQTVNENFPYLSKELHSQIQPTRTPKYHNPKRASSRHIVLKLASKINDRKRIIKAARK